MKEKRNNILPILLTVIILGLISYILVDHDVIKIPELNKNEPKVEDKTKNEFTKIDVDNPSMIKLLKQVHNPSEERDSLIYEEGGSKVSEMSEEYKFSIATNTKDITIIPLDPKEQNGYTGYVLESDVKAAYEKLFGPNTYHQINTFKLACVDMNYDTENKRYVTTTSGCGIAITPIEVYEEVISAKKDNHNLFIVTTTAFYDASVGKLYQDSNLTKETPLTANVDLTEEEISKYIVDHKEDLTQYTYTFKIGTDGFYYYQGVTKNK